MLNHPITSKKIHLNAHLDDNPAYKAKLMLLASYNCATLGTAHQ